jgi:hypothetical protein
MGSTLKVLWDINLAGSLLVSQRFRKTGDYGVEDRPEYLKRRVCTTPTAELRAGNRATRTRHAWQKKTRDFSFLAVGVSSLHREDHVEDTKVYTGT